MTAVSNSAPLIALARIGHLTLLQSLYANITIPQAVHDEVVGAGQNRPGATEVATADWIKVQAVKDQIAVDLLREQLDRGESEAIVLTLETNAQLLLIDEARGRRLAQGRGVTHIGTVGIIVLAKRQRLIESAISLLDDLTAAGFRMDRRLYQRAKELAGE